MSLNPPVRRQHRSVRVLAGASIALAAALAGCGPDVDGATESTSTPSASAGASAAPSLAGYSLTIPEISPIQVVVPLPDGWSQGGWVVVKNAAHLGLFPVANVYQDPCHWSGSLPDPAVGPKVEDLAGALVNQPTRNATASDITLDGYAGVLVKLSVQTEINFADCDGGLFASWSEAGSDAPSRYAHGPGEVEDVYIIDVDGTRVVIDAAHMPLTSAAELAELDGMVASVDIRP
jgi:hypothetical protein